MRNYRHAAEMFNQRRYLTVAFACSAAPIAVVLILPEPLRSSLMPIVAIFGAYSSLYGLALLLMGIEWLWGVLRPRRDAAIRCPTCRTVEVSYRRFFVNRIGAHLVRVQCPECHERWIERR